MAMGGNLITSGRKSFNWLNFTTAILLSLGSLVHGYFTGIIATTLTKASFSTYMLLADANGNPTHNSAALAGATTGVFQAGGICGIVLTGIMADKIGRKKTAIFLSAAATVSSAVLSASRNISMFIALRFFTGATGFGYLVLMIVYVSELAPAALRGLYVGFNGALDAFGFALSSYFGVGFFSASAEVQWRVPLALGTVFPLVLTVVYIFLPDSPRYLLLKGRRDEALKVMMSQHGRNGHQDFARAEFFQIERQAEMDKDADSSWKYFLGTRSVQRRIAIACILAFLSQSTGNLVINNYGGVIFKTLGYNDYTQLCLQAGYITLIPVFNVVGSGLCDRLGRRPLLFLGFTGCMLCVSVTAMISALFADAGTNREALTAGAAMIFLFGVFYSLCGDVCVFVIIGEIFPNHLRAKGSLVAMGANALTNLVYLQVSPTAFDAIGWKYFLVFIAVTFCGLIWMYFAVPETKGIALEELAEIFGEFVAVHAADITVDHDEVHVKGEPGEGGDVNVISTEGSKEVRETVHHETVLKG